MISTVVKRSIVIEGQDTSVSLEDAFWTALKEIAASHHATASALVTAIDRQRQARNLSSALRIFVLEYYRELAAGGSVDDLIKRMAPDLTRSVPAPFKLKNGS